MGLLPSKIDLLQRAIEHDDLSTVKSLLKDFTSDQIVDLCRSLISINGKRTTLIHYATWQNNGNLLLFLLDYVRDLEIRDDFGWTPLMSAVQRGSKANVRILLDRGAQINCDSNHGRDLIAVAMTFHDRELIQMLLEHQIQLNIPTDFSIDNEQIDGCYLLHFAVDEGLFEISKLLLDKGQVSVDTLNERGWSPLHLAVRHNRLDLVRLLLKYDADINIEDHHGNTPLAWARALNSKEIVDELERLNARADEQWHGEKFQLRSPETFELDQSNKETSKSPDALQRWREKSISS